MSSSKIRNNAWIGVDLDGTLAEYFEWRGIYHIGEPIKPMVERIQRWLSEGKRVKIFTARVTEVENNLDGSKQDIEGIKRTIEQWCLTHIGSSLEITNVKDFGMIELWDDRAIRVGMNTGNPCCNYRKGY